MNKTYLSAIQRLRIYSQIFSEAGHHNIYSLSKYLEIPVKVVRADIITLLGDDSALILAFNEACDSSSFDVDDFIDKAKLLVDNNVCPSINRNNIDDFIYENYEILIKKGLLDTLELFCDLEADIINPLEIMVTQEEYNAYRAFLYVNDDNTDINKTYKNPLSKNETYTSQILNKDFLGSSSPETVDKVSMIEKQISDLGAISFNYNESDEKVNIYPSIICFDKTDGNYVTIGFYKNKLSTFYLDKMDNITVLSGNELNKCEICTYDDTWLQVTDKVWGFEFDKLHDNKGRLKKPTRIKVKFYDEGNVKKKLDRDLCFRNYTPGSLLYEDDVYGIDSFIKWVSSYGSSAIILSPKSVREQFLLSLEERLAILTSE